jgi:uncharacterized protein (TIRG00374 family)
MNSVKGQIISLVAALGILAGLVYFSDFNRIIEVLQGTNLYYIFLGVIVWIVTAIIRVIRWRSLLAYADIRIPFISAFRILVSSLFISNLTPAKIGDPIRSLLLKKVSGFGVGRSLTSVIIERMFDVFAIVVISLVGLGVIAYGMAYLYLPLVFAVLLYFIVIIVVVYFLVSEKRLKKLIMKLYSIFRFVPFAGRFEGKLERFSEGLTQTFPVYKKKKILGMTFVYSVMIWVLEGATLFLGFKALGLEITLISAVVIFPIANLISVLTLLPGGIGSTEIITVLFFSSLFSLGLPEITAAVLIGRLLSFWIYIIVGALIFSNLKFKYKL